MTNNGKTIFSYGDLFQIFKKRNTKQYEVIAAQFGISQSTVWQMLRQDLLYSLHVQLVQPLLPRDLPLRLKFCEWLLYQQQLNPKLYHEHFSYG